MAEVRLFRAVPFARIGSQDYLAHELDLEGDPNRVIQVERSRSEVRQSAPSFRNVPLTSNHPSELVGRGSLERLAVGIVSDAWFDSDTGQLRGDLWVWDDQAVIDIIGGKRELSAGYIARYEPKGNGFEQTAIKGNHVALVSAGRSGMAQRIGAN